MSTAMGIFMSGQCNEYIGLGLGLGSHDSFFYGPDNGYLGLSMAVGI